MAPKKRKPFEPYWRLARQDECGFSGRSKGYLALPVRWTETLFRAYVGESPVRVGTPQNPYRDLSYGGTTFGIVGLNVWVPDECLVGKILAWLVGGH